MSDPPPVPKAFDAGAVVASMEKGLVSGQPLQALHELTLQQSPFLKPPDAQLPSSEFFGTGSAPSMALADHPAELGGAISGDIRARRHSVSALMVMPGQLAGIVTGHSWSAHAVTEQAEYGGVLSIAETLAPLPATNALAGSFMKHCVLPRLEAAYADHVKKTQALLRMVAPDKATGGVAVAKVVDSAEAPSPATQKETEEASWAMSSGKGLGALMTTSGGSDVFSGMEKQRLFAEMESKTKDLLTKFASWIAVCRAAAACLPASEQVPSPCRLPSAPPLVARALSCIPHSTRSSPAQSPTHVRQSLPPLLGRRADSQARRPSAPGGNGGPGSGGFRGSCAYVQASPAATPGH